VDGDAVIVAQKVVSKAEGRIRTLSQVSPSERAIALGQKLEADPRMVQVILDETTRVVRDDRVSSSRPTRGSSVPMRASIGRNVDGADNVCLLPIDCDASARSLHERIHELTRVRVGVIVSDTFGRAWRMGLVNVALGVAGMPAMIDYRGHRTTSGCRCRQPWSRWPTSWQPRRSC